MLVSGVTLVWTHGVLAQPPFPLTRCVHLIQDAEKIPAKTYPEPPGSSSPPVISRDGLIPFIEQRRGDLEREAAETKAVEEADDAWSDDAALLLGFLYLSTSADVTWAPKTAVEQYRALVERSRPIQLNAWTLDQVNAIPRIAHAWNERVEPDSGKVARIFARLLVSHALSEGGATGAEHELASLKSAPNLSPLVIQDLSAMIYVYKERIEGSR